LSEARINQPRHRLGRSSLARATVTVADDIAHTKRCRLTHLILLALGCFFIFTPRLLRERGNRIGAAPLMFEMEALEAVDIDIEEDFALAVAIAESGGINP
jgi:CMP-N-acetylneuraminic acid synthetase